MAADTQPQFNPTGLLIVMAVAGAFFYFIILPFQPRPAPDYGRNTCLSNLKQTGVAMKMYQADFNDHMPLAKNWNDSMKPYTLSPDIGLCERKYFSGFNKLMSGKREASLTSTADELVMFDTVSKVKNTHGGHELLPPGGRHKSKNNAGFADTHVKTLPLKDPTWLKLP